MSISKFKKPYNLILTPFYYEKQLKDQPHTHTLVYLKPFQETVPTGALVEISTSDVQLTFKREAVLVYRVHHLDHQKREIYARLIGIKKKQYHGINRYPSNTKLISVRTKLNHSQLVYTILHRQLLRSTERQALKAAVAKALAQQLSQFNQAIHSIASKDLNDKLAKTVGAQYPFFKGLIVDSYRLRL